VNEWRARETGYHLVNFCGCLHTCLFQTTWFFVENGVVVNKPNKDVYIVLKFGNWTKPFVQSQGARGFGLLLYMNQTWRLILELISPWAVSVCQSFSAKYLLFVSIINLWLMVWTCLNWSLWFPSPTILSNVYISKNKRANIWDVVHVD